MNQEKINNAYNEGAGKYAERYYNELDYKPLDRQLLDRFSDEVKNKGRVCDIGCGPGEVANYLYEKGLKVMGIDASEGMIREATRLNRNIEFILDDMMKLKSEDQVFEGITSSYAIVNFDYEHVLVAIKEYHRTLKMNGLLFLSFHVNEGIISVDDFFETGIPLDFYLFDENKIVNMLKDVGFEISEALVRFPYKEEYPTKRCYILASKIPE